MGLTKKAAYAVGMIRKHGLRGLAIKVMETKYEPIDHEYTKNWQNYMVTKEEWKEIENYIEKLEIENGYVQELGEHEEEYVPKWDI